MKSPFQRIAALALCFTLTLGAFAYRPSEAKAIAGVDDAVVIGALLSAFAGGCGLIFSNNGMTSGELAQGLTDKWNEFNESAENAASSFAAWLGFEDTSALLGALSFSGGKLVIPRAIARKLSEFTTWLVDNLNLTVGKTSVVNQGLYSSLMSDFSCLKWRKEPDGSISLGADCGFFKYEFSCAVKVNGVGFNGSYSGFDSFLFFSNKPISVVSLSSAGKVDGVGNLNSGVYLVFDHSYSGFNANLAFVPMPQADFARLNGSASIDSRTLYMRICDWSPDVVVGNSAADLSVFAPSYYKNPTIDLPVEGEEAAKPKLSGVGDGTATTIEELLQQILAQLQANTLAPTLDLAGTQTGGNTGTDEDAKPYLPYIPQIFEKIKELPGTLANIWESIKGIPAAIAEKIGAFFTTLWGWLQNIIDAITALPAAIAEKIGALFKPDEALLTEITDTFKGKFGFFSTLKQFGSDLFGMTPETEPPVIWVHLENAESKFGYNYGDKQKIFDMTWYQKYKASVDGLLSGFLWLGYLWLLFKRAPAILGGMQLSVDDAPRSADMPDVLSSPRLGAGDGSTMYRGDGFTMRDKGGRSK